MAWTLLLKKKRYPDGEVKLPNASNAEVRQSLVVRERILGRRLLGEKGQQLHKSWITFLEDKLLILPSQFGYHETLPFPVRALALTEMKDKIRKGKEP
jgi:hypothetical protein